MNISKEHLHKLKTLLSYPSSSSQAIELIESLTLTEDDFRQFLECLCNYEIPNRPSLAELKIYLSPISYNPSQISYLALWALGTLAQWNTDILHATTEIVASPVSADRS